MAPTVRNLTDVLEDPTEDLPTIQQIAELFLRTSTTAFTNKTLNDINNFIYANGLHLKVTALEDINIGQPVKFTSYNLGQDEIQVNLADNTLGAAIGLAKENILSGNEFTIVCCGCLKGFDTTAYNDGETLYLGTNGTLTHTEPTTGIAQPLAFVIKSAGDANGALRVDASYPKQDADDVRYDSEGNSVHDVLSVMSNKNLLINGGFDVWQRGTSFSNPNIYTADRWVVNKVGIGTLTISGFTPSNSDRGYTYLSLHGSSLSHADKSILQQKLEFGELYENKTFTVSLNTDNTVYNQPIDVYIEYGEVDTPSNYQRIQVGTIVSDGSTIVTFTAPTITITTAGGKLDDMYFALRFHIPNPEDGEVIRIKNIQLEKGSVATPFEQRPIGYELSLCQRYYRINPRILVSALSATELYIIWAFSEPMRIAPTVSLVDTSPYAEQPIWGVGRSPTNPTLLLHGGDASYFAGKITGYTGLITTIPAFLDTKELEADAEL